MNDNQINHSFLARDVLFLLLLMSLFAVIENILNYEIGRRIIEKYGSHPIVLSSVFGEGLSMSTGFNAPYVVTAGRVLFCFSFLLGQYRLHCLERNPFLVYLAPTALYLLYLLDQHMVIDFYTLTGGFSYRLGDYLLLILAVIGLAVALLTFNIRPKEKRYYY